MQHKEGEFVTHDNTSLYYQAWLPDDEPSAVILYLHGGFSHSGEGKFVGEQLSAQGAGVYAMDQRGWGKSYPEKPGHISHRQQAIDDVFAFTEFVTTLPGNSGCPVILMGVGMGGLLGLRSLIQHQEAFDCGVFASPWIGTRQPIPTYIKLFGGLLSAVMPKFSADSDIKIDELTHDNAVINTYYNDLKSGLRKQKGTARWFAEIQKAQKEVLDMASEITLPTIIMQAGQDLMVSEAKSKDVYNSLSSEKKEWQYYERSYHEVWNEVDRESHISEAWEFIEEVVKG